MAMLLIKNIGILATAEGNEPLFTIAMHNYWLRRLSPLTEYGMKQGKG